MPPNTLQKNNTNPNQIMSATQPFPLSQLNTCAPRQVLPKIAGKLVSVFKRHEGENDKGPWSVQDIEIEDQGAKVKAKVWNKPEIPRSDQGKYIEIMANEGKSGLTALFVEDDTYNGATTRILRLTKTAIIQIGRPGAPQSDAPPSNDQPRNDPPPRQEPPPSQSAPPSSGSGSQLNDAKKDVMKLANCFVLAAASVEQVIPEIERISGQNVTEEKKGGMITSVCLEAWRKGVHTKLPAKPLKLG